MVETLVRDEQRQWKTRSAQEDLPLSLRQHSVLGLLSVDGILAEDDEATQLKSTTI
jgi:hypothetical protein